MLWRGYARGKPAQNRVSSFSGASRAQNIFAVPTVKALYRLGAEPGLARRQVGFYSRPAISDPLSDMSWLRLIFVWWRSATPGTLLTTWWSGRFVGEDTFGNRYYQSRDGKRRWLIYNGTVEASRVPAEWHGWLHHTFAEPPTIAPTKIKPWEKEHVPNMTGTDLSYRPSGSLAASGRHAPATGDYEPWKPE